MGMNMELGQSLKQVQQLSTQQLQYLSLLQMNILELNEHLRDLQLENPLLELSEPAVPLERSASPIDLARWVAGDVKEPRDASGSNDDGDDVPSFEEMHADDRDNYSLEEFLKNQIDLSVDGEEYRMILWLIGYLDHNGYLTVTDEQLAKEFSCDIELAREAIAYLQTFDPPGIGAKNLGECLQIQLIRLGIYGEDVMCLCENCLEDLAHGRFQKVAKTVNAPVGRVTALYSIIRSLNPRPASAFGGESAAAIIPDVTITETENGLRCTYNKQYSANLSINRSYLSLGDQDNSAKDYLNRKMSQAMWVVRAVQSRQETIERIVDVLLREQEEFFTRDDGALRPLRRKDVAAQLGVHESTVSRAISDKYLQCRRGLFPMRYFFSSTVTKDNGSATSSRTVQERIRDMIDEEDPCHPLSDSTIVKMLGEQGFQIARRTVAKYREELGIASSATRRK